MVQLRSESGGPKAFDPAEASDRRRAISLIPAAPRAEADPTLRRRVLDAQGDALLRRAHALDPDDRALLEALLREGESLQSAAAARGLSTRSVRRRVRRLINRLLSDRFVFVLAEHLSWPAGRRRVGDACVLRGRSMRAAARELSLSVHTIRRHLSVVSAMHQAVTELQAPGARREAPPGPGPARVTP